MRTLMTTLSLTVVVLAVAAASAAAKDGAGVTTAGSCTSGATWKLEAKPDDRRIETEFEVDANRVGMRWRVTLTRDGATVFSGIRKTHGRSGSFTVHRRLAGPASGEIVAVAQALDGSQSCQGQLTF